LCRLPAPRGRLRQHISLLRVPICYFATETARVLSNWIETVAESFKGDARGRADSRFRKVEQAATARQKIVAEQVAEERARQAKTKKLRDLRLAKEAEELAIAAATPKPKPAPKRRTRASAKPPGAR
jgi:hypothetical protein